MQVAVSMGGPRVLQVPEIPVEQTGFGQLAHDLLAGGIVQGHRLHLGEFDQQAQGYADRHLDTVELVRGYRQGEGVGRGCCHGGHQEQRRTPEDSSHGLASPMVSPRVGRAYPTPAERAAKRKVYYFGCVDMSQSSVRKGDAGRPSLFHRLTTGKLAQPKRTATGLAT